MYGSYEKNVMEDDGGFTVDGKRYQLLNERDPSKLPWKDLGIDIVFECTGRFTKREDLPMSFFWQNGRRASKR